MTQKDIEIAAKIIDIVLEDARLHRDEETNEGDSPVFFMGLKAGNTLMNIADILVEYKLNSEQEQE